MCDHSKGLIAPCAQVAPYEWWENAESAHGWMLEQFSEWVLDSLTTIIESGPLSQDLAAAVGKFCDAEDMHEGHDALKAAAEAAALKR